MALRNEILGVNPPLPLWPVGVENYHLYSCFLQRFRDVKKELMSKKRTSRIYYDSCDEKNSIKILFMKTPLEQILATQLIPILIFSPSARVV